LELASLVEVGGMSRHDLLLLLLLQITGGGNYERNIRKKNLSSKYEAHSAR